MARIRLPGYTAAASRIILSRTSVGAAVEYNDAVLQFEYQALLMGKTVGHPVLPVFQEHLLPFSPAFSSPGV